MASTAVFSTIAVALVEKPRVEPTFSLFASMLYLTLLATVLTTYVQTRFQKETTPTRAVIIFALEPVIASLIAYVVLSEYIGLLGVVGGGLIVAGVLVSEFSDTIPLLNRSFDNSES
jgi:drug/metabolite transporter (DMT)-like permease